MKEKVYEFISIATIWLWAYFSPVYPMILTIGFFIIGDTVLGVLAAKKKGLLDHKVSKLFRPAIDKLIGYGIAIMVSHVIERQFIPDFPAMKVISGYLTFIELKSIDENFNTIYGYSIFKSIINRIKPDREENQ